MHAVVVRLRQYAPAALWKHSCPVGHETDALQATRHSLFTQIRPAPHWLLNWHTDDGATHRPATQTVPPVHPWSLAQLLDGATHEPFTHVDPAVGQSLAVVHMHPRTRNAASLGARQSNGSTTPASDTLRGQIQPARQSWSRVHGVAHPDAVQVCPVGHWQPFWHAARVGGVTVRQPTPSQ